MLAGVFVVLCGLFALGLTPTPAHADEIRNASWHLEALRIAEAHKITQGEGVTVAVIDTGFDQNHPDLQGALLQGASASGVAGDPNGHGTGMATLIAGRGHGPGNQDGVLGIAPKAKILPIGLSPPSGYIPDEGLFDPGDLVVAIRAAVDADADVINISLNTSLSPSLEEAVSYAWKSNVPVLIGAGNSPLSFINDFAQLPAAVAVSSSNKAGEHDGKTSYGDGLNLLAPGTDVPLGWAAGRQYYTATGSTSVATAIASGTMALIKAKHPEAGVQELVDRLQLTTTDVAPKGWDQKTGFGVVNPVAALTTEPREVKEPSGSSSEQPAAADPVTWDGGNTTRDVVVSIAVLAAFLGGVATVVVLLVRRRRRRRTPAGPPPSPPQPPAPPQPTTTDPRPWMRP